MIAKSVSILVWRGGAIGDFILTLPALIALRDRWPGSRIELVGYPHVARLALEAGLVDQVRSLDQAGVAQFFSRRPEFPQETIQWIRSFDFVLTYLHDRDGTVQGNLFKAGARQVLYASPLVDQVHAIEHLIKPLEALALYPEHVCPKLDVPPERKNWVREFVSMQGWNGDYVAIHPGSGSPRKNWPLTNFLELAARLAKLGKVPFLLTGEADQPLIDELGKMKSHPPVLRGHALPEVAALLSTCSAYVGNDSGITHLAAAVGVPATALFGPSSAQLWAPRGPHVRVIDAQGPDMSRITVDEVLAAVLR